MAFFSKKPTVVEDEVKKTNRILISDQKKIKEDIEYLESQYTPYFLKSLTQDFEDFKSRIGKSDPNFTHWRITSNDSKSCTFEKSLPHSSWNDKLELNIHHNSEINDKFIIDSVRSSSRGKSVSLNHNQFRDIVLRYLLTASILKSEARLKDTKESFNFMIKIIGSDTHRDVKIDEILK